MKGDTMETQDEPGKEIIAIDEQEVAVSRDPNIVLNEARKAASALDSVLRKKKKKVMFNGKQYLEFEDWQTVGKFYGVTAKVVDKRTIDFGDVRGFEATAVAYHVKTGKEISRADGMCLNDEANWKSKPLFQLSSMAQTRACAKALRNVLSWVVVLAGYAPTPAEEMTGQEQPNGKPAPVLNIRQALWDGVKAYCNNDSKKAGQLLKELTGKLFYSDLTEDEAKAAQIKFESLYLDSTAGREMGED